MNQDARSYATADEVSTVRPPPPTPRISELRVRARRYAFACAEVVFSSHTDTRRDA